MSTNPSWRPNIDPKNKPLPLGVKYPLARRYMDHDGSLSGEVILTQRDVPYLEGLVDVGSGEVKSGAEDLIQAIAVHGEVLFVIR